MAFWGVTWTFFDNVFKVDQFCPTLKYRYSKIEKGHVFMSKACLVSYGVDFLKIDIFVKEELTLSGI